MNKRVIVFGATGKTGIEICNVLNSMDITHSALVRNGSELKIKFEGTNVVIGDVLNKSDVEKALSSENITDAIIALGSRDLKKSDIRSKGTMNIVEVLNENGIKAKVHIISAHGVGDSWSQLKWYEKLISKLFLENTMKDHQLQEEIVKDNNGGYHIVRPVALKDGPATGRIFSTKDGILPNGDINRSDVAKYLVDSMISGKEGYDSICRG